MAKKEIKIIVEHPNGSRKPFFYNVNSDEEAMDLVKWVEKELKNNSPKSFVADYRINEVKK